MITGYHAQLEAAVCMSKDAAVFVAIWDVKLQAIIHHDGFVFGKNGLVETTTCTVGCDDRAPNLGHIASVRCRG